MYFLIGEIEIFIHAPRKLYHNVVSVSDKSEMFCLTVVLERDIKILADRTRE